MNNRYLGNQLFVTLEAIVMEHVEMVNDHGNEDRNVRQLTIPVLFPDIIRPANYHPLLEITTILKRFKIIKVIRINKIK